MSFTIMCRQIVTGNRHMTVKQTRLTFFYVLLCCLLTFSITPDYHSKLNAYWLFFFIIILIPIAYLFMAELLTLNVI